MSADYRSSEGEFRRVRAMNVTLGLAMRAKLEEPDPQTLAMAIIAVGETFAVDDPLRIELRHFADVFPLAKRNPAVLRAAGNALFDAVMRATWPQPSVRADIVG